jgi:hypothetical protein
MKRALFFLNAAREMLDAKKMDPFTSQALHLRNAAYHPRQSDLPFRGIRFACSS